VTGWIDEGLNERAYIVPGLGDFGERRCANPGTGYKDKDADVFVKVLRMTCCVDACFTYLPAVLQRTMKIHAPF
jgi:Uracil phosphoribosyltransferase